VAGEIADLPAMVHSLVVPVQRVLQPFRVLEDDVAEQRVMPGHAMMQPAAPHVRLVRIPLQLLEEGLHGFVVQLIPLGLEHLDDVSDPVSLPHGRSPGTTVR